MTAKSYSVSLQQIKDDKGNPHPWYMSGKASIDKSGSIKVTTHLESHIALSGFTGGMVASFMDAAGKALFVTPILQYGVDGYSVPSWLGATPSPRTVNALFMVDPDIYYSTNTITIYLFHAGKNRLGEICKKVAPVVIEIIKWIIELYVSSSDSNVTSSTSSALIQPSDVPLVSGQSYALITPSGNYLTAVNGGGIGEAANKLPLHTDAKNVGPWEKFKFIHLHGDAYAIQTINGQYITAINGGGMGEAANKLPLHTDATNLLSDEHFILTKTSDNFWTIRTRDGHYVTAVNGGGIGEAANKLPLHTDATNISTWERFALLKH